MADIKINEIMYPATISGKISDIRFQGRSTKTMKIHMLYQDASRLFVDGASWSVVEGEEEFDNSEYNIAGPITDYRNGFIEVTMIKGPQKDSSEETQELTELLNILLGEET